MKKIYLILTLLLVTAVTVNAQRSAFRFGYLRFGFNTLGKDLDPTMSPKANVFAGNYGADRGYVLEMGRIFYFKKGADVSMINYGLDWTYFSLNYNQLDQWEDYGVASGEDFELSGEQLALAVSTKIGPVISINLIEKVVLDARFQLAPTFRFFDHDYYENFDSPEERSFSFINYRTGENDDDYDPESVKNRLGFGVQTNFGLTLRRKAIGLALDFVSGSVKNNYEAVENGSGTFGKEKIKATNFQIKLSLTL